MSDREVASLPPGRHSVGGCPGLLLQVRPGGASWLLRYPSAGRRVELGLGPYPEVRLAEARRLGLATRTQLRAGGDPLADKRQKRAEARAAERTFRAVADDYLKNVKLKELRSDKLRKGYRAVIDLYALPAFGDKNVADISRADILAMLKDKPLCLWETRNVTAVRLRGRVEAVLNFAIAEGYREGPNPATWKGNLAASLPKPSKVASVVNQPAVQLEDAPRFFAAVRAREGVSARALEFVILTALRSGEARGLLWSEVDLESAVATIPASRTKMGREHRVPLTPAAVALLEALPRGSSGLVFEAPRGGILSDMALSAVARKISAADLKAGGNGFPDRVSGRPAVVHGWRSTFRVFAAEKTTVPREIAEQALAHAVGGVEGAYQRSDMLDRRRGLMGLWAGFLAGSAEGSGDRSGGDASGEPQS